MLHLIWVQQGLGYGHKGQPEGREGMGSSGEAPKSSRSRQLYLLLEAKQHHQREAEERQGVGKASDRRTRELCPGGNFQAAF